MFAGASGTPVPRRWRYFRSIAARLLMLLLLAVTPLVFFTIWTKLSNDRLMASDAVSRVSVRQAGALARLDAELRTAAAIARAVQAMPPTLLNDEKECNGALTALGTAFANSIAAIAIHGQDGAARCRIAGAPVPQAALSQPFSVLSAGGGLTAYRRLSGNAGVVAVRVSDLVGADDEPGTSPCLWLVHAGGLVAGAAGVLPGEAPADLAQVIAVSRAGAVRGRSNGGAPFLYSVALLSSGIGGAGDLLLAGTDIRAERGASALTLALRIIQLVGLFAGEFLLIAAGVSVLISRPLRQLGDAVKHWGQGAHFVLPPPGHAPLEVETLTLSFSRAMTELSSREAELTEAARRQEHLMHEIHHRVKNNLQIVASLLNLQAVRIKVPEAAAEFQVARDRVRALATLHRHLYAGGDLHAIDLQEFFCELCGQLFQSLNEVQGERIKVQITAPRIAISSDQAVPIALIVTEIVGNAVRYAFPDRREGHVFIDFTPHGDGRATLSVRDDGIGLDQQPQGGLGGGLGMQLIKGFARQLGGQLVMTSQGGTCYQLDMVVEPHRTHATPGRPS